MKVLQLGPFPPPHGGVQTNLVAIRDCLRAHGHSAPVINITRHRKPEADEVFYPASAAQTARLLWRVKADIVHLHLGGNLTLRLLALCLFCSSLPGRKTVLTFHSGGYPGSLTSGVTAGRTSLEGVALSRLDGLIAVNEEIAQFFRRRGVTPERIRVISPYSAPPPPAAELPEPLASFWNQHDPVLLSVGLLEPEYDLAMQIDALGEMRKTHPRAGLVMIGSGSLEAELRARIAARPFAEHLLLPGDVPHPATLRAIRDCSVLLRTTHYDGDSVSVREALAMGTPVIASRTAFRPPGCHLLPELSLQHLTETICGVLAEVRVAPSYPTPPDRENLDAILDFYRYLLAP